MTRRRESVFYATRQAVVLICCLCLLAVVCVLVVESSALDGKKRDAFASMDRIATQLISDTDTPPRIDPVSLKRLNQSYSIHGLKFVNLSGVGPAGIPVDLQQEEYSSAARVGEGWRRDSGHPAKIHLVRTVVSNGVHLGYLTTTLSTDAIEEEQGAVRQSIAVGGALVALFGLIATFSLDKRRAASIEVLRRHISALARGSHQQIPPTMKTWELADCMNSLSSIAEELTERIQRSAQNKKELTTILASMSEGLLAVDQEGQVILVNDAGRKILSLDDRASLPATLAEIPDAAVFQDLIRRTMEAGVALAEEIDLNDSGRNIAVQIAPLRDENRDVGGAVCLLSDVTSVRRLENMRREFVANVSHELKTPLTAIQGAAETIHGDESMPAAIREKFISQIVKNARRLDCLINDVLELSRLQSSDEHLSKSRQNLIALARESVAQFKETASLKGVTLKIEVPDDELFVDGDLRALKSVVDNLVVNAVKYTPRGGRVLVRLKSLLSQVVLEVSDTGEGIASEHQARIFERFYRVDAARSRVEGGTGLGLAIVKNCVLAHDGQIEVESQVGEGSTFRVKLPRSSF